MLVYLGLGEGIRCKAQICEKAPQKGILGYLRQGILICAMTHPYPYIGLLEEF